MTYEQVLDHFKVIQKVGNSARCICPAHADKKPSLSISKGNKGTVLHCMAGCETGDILAAVGMTWQDLYEEDKEPEWREKIEKRTGKRIEGEYLYRDIITGKYVFTRLRLTGKDFMYGVVSGDQFTFGLNGRQRKTIPAIYGDLGAIRAAKVVYYCEGEKDVNTVRNKGLCGVTCGGSGDWTPATAPIFKDKKVVILQDNDEAGAKLAAAVSESLTGIAKSVTTIIPCTTEKGADITDFFTQGGTVEQLERMIPGPRLESAAALLKRDIPPLKHVVNGLITEGVGLLAAMQKMGKTWMCYQLAGCVASGKPFLGREVTRGSVLYFDLEQAEQLRQERLKLMMPDAPDNLYFIDQAETIGEGFESMLRGYLEDIPDTQLVIIDVMDMVADDMKRQESPKKHAYRNISALKQIAREKHIAIICVMHFRKMKDPDDFMSNISGSNGWCAAADYAIGISRRRGEPTAALQTDGRTTKSVVMQITQDEKTMCWTSAGDFETIEQQRVEQAFKESDITRKLVAAVEAGGGHWEGTAGALIGTALFDLNVNITETPAAVTRNLKNYTELYRKLYRIKIIDRNENNTKAAFFVAEYVS